MTAPQKKAAHFDALPSLPSWSFGKLRRAGILEHCTALGWCHGRSFRRGVSHGGTSSCTHTDPALEMDILALDRGSLILPDADHPGEVVIWQGFQEVGGGCVAWVGQVALGESGRDLERRRRWARINPTPHHHRRHRHPRHHQYQSGRAHEQ